MKGFLKGKKSVLSLLLVGMLLIGMFSQMSLFADTGISSLKTEDTFTDSSEGSGQKSTEALSSDVEGGSFNSDKSSSTPSPKTDVDTRLEIAERNGLSKWVDEEGYFIDTVISNFDAEEMESWYKNDTDVDKLFPEEGWSVANVSEYRSTRATGGSVISVDTDYKTMGYRTSSFVISMGDTGFYGKAFCAQHSVKEPEAGHYLSNGGGVTNEYIRKALYYWDTGWCSSVGISDRVLSLMISRFNGDSMYINKNFVVLENQLKEKPNAPVSYQAYWATPGDGKQNLVYGFDQPTGTCNLVKKSSIPDITNMNPNYSLEGAVYGVYTGSDATGLVATLKTDANGNSNSVTLNSGWYYVKETQAPKGYYLNPEIYSVWVPSGGTGTVQASDYPCQVNIRLTKVSNNPECTDTNENYSLEGAKYNVYLDEACTSYYTQIVTDAKGYCETGFLPLGTYYIKEVKASKGFEIDTTVHKVDATVVSHESIAKDVTSSETPILDPVGILLKKVDAESGGKPVGNGSLEGAQFEVKFYDKITDNLNDLEGLEPKKSWIFKTDKDGYMQYGKDWLVSGDSFYLDPQGTPSLPYGTITFKEIKSPNGYLLNSDLIIVPINRTASSNIVYQQPIQNENALTLSLLKKQSDYNKPIPDCVFEHTLPDGSKEKLSTDENGKVYFKGLQWGKHTIKEIEVPDGYSVNKNNIEFEVGQDNSIKILSNFTVSDVDGNIVISLKEGGNIDAVYDNKPALYSLNVFKTNNHDFALEGAEFTLYNNASCSDIVAVEKSDSKGNLTFKGLVPDKEYWLKETKAPKGYRIPVNENGSDIIWKVLVKSIPVENQFKFHVNDKVYTKDSDGIWISGTKNNREVNLHIVNKVGSQLPATGSSMTLVILLFGCLLVVSAYIVRRNE